MHIHTQKRKRKTIIRKYVGVNDPLLKCVNLKGSSHVSFLEPFFYEMSLKLYCPTILVRKETEPWCVTHTSFVVVVFVGQCVKPSPSCRSLVPNTIFCSPMWTETIQTNPGLVLGTKRRDEEAPGGTPITWGPLTGLKSEVYIVYKLPKFLCTSKYTNPVPIISPSYRFPNNSV